MPDIGSGMESYRNFIGISKISAYGGIETAYETLKNRLQLENFTGTKPILLLQDIYSTIYLSNLVEDIILDAERELDQKETNRKHKMMINQTVSIGILKTI